MLHLDLSDDEAAALIKELYDTIHNDRSIVTHARTLRGIWRSCGRNHSEALPAAESVCGRAYQPSEEDVRSLTQGAMGNFEERTMTRDCEICDNLAEEVTIHSPRWREVRRCPRCGEFEFDGSVGLRKNPSIDEIVRLSGWVREQNANGVVPAKMTREAWRRVVNRQPPKLRERANRALGVIARRHPNVREIINLAYVVTELELLGITYSQTADEATQLIEILLDDGYLRWDPLDTLRRNGSLTSKGLLAAEALGASGSGAQGFVAMWFDASMNEAWLSGFEPGIKAAGYHAVRLDKEDYVGGVTDEIMTQIRRSRFVVVITRAIGTASISRPASRLDWV